LRVRSRVVKPTGRGEGMGPRVVGVIMIRGTVLIWVVHDCSLVTTGREAGVDVVMSLILWSSSERVTSD
jgi:hypothetical protein